MKNRILASLLGLLVGLGAAVVGATPNWQLNNGSVLHNSASLTPAAATANACAAVGTTITVAGAQAGASCFVGEPANAALTAIVPFCNVTAADTVTVTLCNVGAGTPTPVSGTYSVTVVQ